MKLWNASFGNHFLSMVGIIVLFCCSMLSLFFSVLIWAWQTSRHRTSP